MDQSDKTTEQRKHTPLWKSKSLLIALAITVVGLLFWHPWSSQPAPARSLPPGVSSFAGATTDTTGETQSTSTSASPALFRFGASYLAGFFIGWFCRKSLKLAFLVGGAVALGLLVLQSTGKINVEWSAIQNHLSQSFAWLRGELGALKDFVTGYLPSTGAGVVGIFMGVRRG